MTIEAGGRQPLLNESNTIVVRREPQREHAGMTKAERWRVNVVNLLIALVEPSDSTSEGKHERRRKALIDLQAKMVEHRVKVPVF